MEGNEGGWFYFISQVVGFLSAWGETLENAGTIRCIHLFNSIYRLATHR